MRLIPATFSDHFPAVLFIKTWRPTAACSQTYNRPLKFRMASCSTLKTAPDSTASHQEENTTQTRCRWVGGKVAPSQVRKRDRFPREMCKSRWRTALIKRLIKAHGNPATPTQTCDERLSSLHKITRIIISVKS